MKSEVLLLYKTFNKDSYKESQWELAKGQILLDNNQILIGLKIQYRGKGKITYKVYKCKLDLDENHVNYKNISPLMALQKRICGLSINYLDDDHLNLNEVGIIDSVKNVNKIEYQVIYDNNNSDWHSGGEIAGSIDIPSSIRGVNIMIPADIDYDFQISGTFEGYGFLPAVGEDEVVGILGTTARLNGLLFLCKEFPTLRVDVLSRNKGWCGPKKSGEIAGSLDFTNYIDQLKFEFVGDSDYDVRYAVFINKFGWTDYYIGPQEAGFDRMLKYIEALRVKFTPKKLQ